MTDPEGGLQEGADFNPRRDESGLREEILKVNPFLILS